MFQNTLCCDYGTKGTKTSGYDCLMIPGASKATGGAAPATQCGGGGGLVTATGTTLKTVCCKFIFHQDIEKYIATVRASF